MLIFVGLLLLLVLVLFLVVLVLRLVVVVLLVVVLILLLFLSSLLLLTMLSLFCLLLFLFSFFFFLFCFSLQRRHRQHQQNGLTQRVRTRVPWCTRSPIKVRITIPLKLTCWVPSVKCCGYCSMAQLYSEHPTVTSLTTAAAGPPSRSSPCTRTRPRPRTGRWPL